MNKPLTKDELFEVETACGEAEMERLFRRLVSAEAFWREAVKNASNDGTFQGSNFDCMFCGEGVDHGDPHKPECAWLLAQEEK